MFRRIIMAAVLIALQTGDMAILQAQLQPGPDPRPGPNHPVAPQQEAADAIGRAYDALGRDMALTPSAARNVNGLLMRSRDTYQQALSLYQAGDFTAARETAMASTDIAHAVEQLATADLPGAAPVPSPPPPPGPPDRADTPSARAYRDLARVQEHSARLNTDLNQSASASVAAQVRVLINESGQLEQRAQSLAANKPEQAGAIARAADALLAAADHYVRRAWIASGLAPPSPPPPPRPKRLPPPP
jgi:hypothetical protein